VVDAIKPTIILKGEIVQMGEVVVGRPPYAVARPVAAPEAASPATPEQDDATPVPIHEVETITMAPPLRKWSPAEEKTPEEEKPDAPAISALEDTSPHETPVPLPEKREPDVKPSAEIPDGPMLDLETAAAVEAEERQNSAEEAPVVAGIVTQGETDNADAEHPAPRKTRRRRVSAETTTDTAPENEGTPDKKTTVRKARTSAARKPRKKTAAAPEDTDVTPKEEA
jgi:hypothetical protein